MIRVAELRKVYRAAPPAGELLRGRWRGREVVALDGVSLDVAAGEVVGVMGENGAGKTTLLRLLAGLTTPSSGTLEVDGARGGAPLRRRVGCVITDERSFSQRLTVRENLAFFGALHGLARREALARADSLALRVGLGAHLHRRYHELSTGMRQRAAVARGLLGDPPVLLLDEPTRGIDPAGRLALRVLLAAESRGRTVVMATHDCDEAVALCARVVLLARGRVTHVVPPAAAAALLIDAAGDGASAREPAPGGRGQGEGASAREPAPGGRGQGEGGVIP